VDPELSVESPRATRAISSSPFVDTHIERREDRGDGESLVDVPVAVLVASSTDLNARRAGHALGNATVETSGDLALTVAHAADNGVEALIDEPVAIVVDTVALLWGRKVGVRVICVAMIGVPSFVQSRLRATTEL
jgi:hypothetical protein